MRGAEQALATLRDYVERSTHWQEGGADRHSALDALKALDQVALDIKCVELEVTQALGYADEIAIHQEASVSYETLQRSGFKRPMGWRKKYSLVEARSAARSAANHLRNAWQLLDPIK